ncbi:MAG: hypothetical protein AB7V56_01925 [Candidatus Nitrosocosmicus sp.]|jgi:uncharacterized protein YegP (UPF0339 family)|uniref:hypothetical protein n=1 Tax=Candidatus Nitrosocosmicus agrestis TaxID=2563600 RepID=UPI00122E00BD|nr:hypothetical protein [Candidatus Nitrosocosmicus sp. SS]KAA2281960.1 hypothetical protein F1Z66_07325 [Candidatus Nitrosocosmicus sp. SS]MDR4490657.1 hypothetical protein [Candidatus Nitrosocosmicus sp.]
MVSCVLIAYLAITSHYCDSSFAQIPDNSDNNMENVRNSILLNGSNKEVSNNTILLYQVKIGNSLYPVEISSSGRQVNNLLYDTDEKSLVLIMEPPDINNTSNNGTLDIEIPRVILNSQINKIDQNFTVTIDGHPTKFKETTKKIISSIKSNSTKDNTTSLENINQIGDNRKLAIEFAQDSKIIKITGMDINEPRNQMDGSRQELLRIDIPFNAEDSIKFISIYLDGANLGFSQFQSNSSNQSLLLSIIPYKEKGTLDIEIPRVILNSQINKIDQNFTVTIDGHPTKFKETTKKIISSIKSNSTKDNTTSLENINQIGDNRKLAIEFAQDSKIIKITGMDINEPRNQVNQNNQSSMTGQSSTLNNEEQQNILIAIISASTGVIVAFIYTLYSKNKIKFKRSKKK